MNNGMKFDLIGKQLRVIIISRTDSYKAMKKLHFRIGRTTKLP